MNPAEIERRASEIDWYHTIELGGGVVTPGAVPIDAIPDELLPDCAGRSVLDIGTWDGANAFRAERAGADRVVALDHYVWGVDFERRQAYWADCAARGVLPDSSRDETEFWDPSLPRKRGFDLAREALGSSVEPMVADFMTMDLDALGKFDVVLYLGILYHMREPLTALQRVCRITGEVAVIETAAVHFRERQDASLLQFLPGAELSQDYTNWYVPTERALHGMCRAAGFREVVTRRGVPHPGRRRPPTQQYRIVVHARP